MSSPSTAPTVFVRQRTIAPLALAFIFFLSSAQVSSAQSSDLQTAASKLDNLITTKHKTKVIITDFFGPKDSVTEFGQAIADELSAALATANANLTVLPRYGQSYTFGGSGSRDFKEGAVASMLGKSFGAEVVVTGNLIKRSGSVDLNIHVWNVPAAQNIIGGDSLGEFTTRIPISPEQEVQLGRVIPQDPPTGFALTAGKKPAALAAVPMCISCASPPGLGKAQVNLALSVNEKGLVTNVELISTTDEKIAAKVVKAARQWRFRPAHGPDGQPIASQVPFQLSLGNKLN